MFNFGLRYSSTLRKKNELMNMGQDVCMFLDSERWKIFMLQDENKEEQFVTSVWSKVFDLIDVRDDYDKEIVMF